MIGIGRPSKLKGAGFFTYDGGKRTGLWSGLAEEFPVAEQQIPLRDMQDRMLFAEALETAKCFEEGVITSAAAANIGSIMGIGFPPMAGGAVQFMAGYIGHGAQDEQVGIEAFLARADELAAAYGDRFAPTAWLPELAAPGGAFTVLSYEALALAVSVHYHPHAVARPYTVSASIPF